MKKNVRKTQRGGWFRRKHPKLTHECRHKWWSFKRVSDPCRLERKIVKTLAADDDVSGLFDDNRVQRYDDVCEKLRDFVVTNSKTRRKLFDFLEKQGNPCETADELLYGKTGAESLGRKSTRKSSEKLKTKEPSAAESLAEYNQFVKLHSNPEMIQRTQMELDLISKLQEVAVQYVGWIEWKIETFLDARNKSDLLTILIKQPVFRTYIIDFIPELLNINKIGNYVKDHHVALYVSIDRLTNQLLQLIIRLLSSISSSTPKKEGDPPYLTQGIIAVVDVALDRLRSD
jgi:hypothetical protein